MDEHVLPADVARAIAAMRGRVVKACKVCGKTFEGLKVRRYCSAACRQRAHARRRGVVPRNSGDVPPLVARLDATREAIMHGRRFDIDSAQLIRESRKERFDEL
jgi:hypothetical protein